MGALATCTVSRLNGQHLDQPDIENGFAANEESYSGTILFFENAKAYVIRTDTKQLFWVSIKLLTNLTASV